MHFIIRAAFCTVALALSSAQAALVEWDLNPNDANGSAGSSHYTFKENGFSIEAYGFDRVSGPDTAHELWFKDDGSIHGLGLADTAHNQVQVGQYIQFDLNSLLAAGVSDGQIKVSGMFSGDAFDIYGSNTLGQLGNKISALGGPYAEQDNNDFVNIPNFGDYRYISVMAENGDVLPWGFAAKMPAIPELGGAASALVLFAFFGVVLATRKMGAKHR